MMNRCRPFSRKSRPGVTLIEIVVGLVVLAVLVSSVTLARGRLMRQWSEAERKVQAASAVDQMMAGWIGGGDSDSIPVPSQGTLQGVEGCIWRTNWAADGTAQRIGARVVRVEIFEGRNRLLMIDVLKHTRTRADGDGKR
jgi:prepilin-type N-terminal cleavage/methylation domain-containing protein